ncbi:CBS domain-containing protein [Sulfurivirga caldicuralii]|uniref:CBS domain-containing protein n=1 Tax=Sulfurivirga caldicuralii TaxID=364032 RepID=A0A1N6FHF9_9GAMM|nr:putative nucleotidyltransferase substrate binding domain-containing protein [Sulfurivirga caldicuralii]SIN94670.1 CBS domain-containing protein [Sulfurivirga caldicuralii]
MEIEQRELFRFLKQTPPLSTLDDATLRRWVEAVQIAYFRTGETILSPEQPNREVCLIRSGAVDVFDANGELVNALAEGDWLGYRSVLNDGQVSLTIRAAEDTLLYCFPAELFLKYYAQHPSFQQFFAQHKPSRLRQALQQLRHDTLAIPLDQAISTLAQTTAIIDLDTPVQAAARQWQTLRTPLIVRDARTQTLHALLTPEVLASHLAAGGGPDDAVATCIRKRSAVLLPAGRPLADALVMLLRAGQTAGIVVDNANEPVGVLDIRHFHDSPDSPQALASAIPAAESTEQLIQLSQHFSQLFAHLVRAHTPPYEVGLLISSLGEALTARLVALAEAQQGEAPVSYCFFITGSMARGEQTLHTDQDSGLIQADAFDKALHDNWFATLAQTVSDQLNAAGYAYCPGGIMASNPRWRQPLHRWLKDFRQWIEAPTAEALLQASIFFDMQAVHGDTALFDHLRSQFLKWAPDSGLFLHHMAANALSFRPPLGFFRNLILERTGDHRKVLDLKKRGIAPVVEMARVYALSEGLPALNTWERLQQAQAVGALSRQGFEDLRDALDFIATTRLRHQLNQIDAGLEPDNLIDPRQLSHLERRHLRDSFAVISEMQDAMAQRFGG